MNENDIKEKLLKFEQAIIFEQEVAFIDLNFLDIRDLKELEWKAQQLQIAITGFDLDLYKHDSDMQMFIFETWQKESAIAKEVAIRILKNYLEEYV